MRVSQGALLFFLGCAGVATAADPPGKRIPLPNGTGGVGLDDMKYAPALGSVVVPAGRTGMIDLIDPKTGVITSIGGFSTSAPGTGHGEGTTSADEGDGFLFATDRTTRELVVVAEAPPKIVARARLAGSPDYVRWIESTHEIWVTEPDAERIEVFRLSSGFPPAPRSVSLIAVPGGPESRDRRRPRAGVREPVKAETVAIDLPSRKVTARWSNGCGGARGLALDGRRGFLFVACTEGKAVSIDVESGKALSTVAAPKGIDIIDFNASLSHLYVPGARDAAMAVVAVSAAGGLAVLGTLPTVDRAHCVAAGPSGEIFVCDPSGGAVLAFHDPFPGEKP
jgi:hypothetical protein